MRDNNFDLIRLCAATAVLISHAFPISAGSNASEPLFVLTGGQVTLGIVSIYVFFAISGYLVSASYDRTHSPMRFVEARGLRLMPGLFGSLFLTAFILGPAVTNLAPDVYLIARDTYRFVWKNLAMLFTPGLPGVFLANPEAGVVNGSLHTLRYETACYFLVLVFGVVGLLSRWPVTVLLSLLVVGNVIFDSHFIEYALPFFTGSLLYVWRHAFNRYYAALCAVLLLCFCAAGQAKLGFGLFGSYLVLWMALAPKIIPSPLKGDDLSYGIYIYAYPVQQTVRLLLGDESTWLANIILSLPVTFTLAYVSWRFIEKPALQRKGYFVALFWRLVATTRTAASSRAR